MQTVECSGSSPYEIGYQHGHKAAEAVSRSVEFYTDVFKDSCKLSWDEALERAKPFESSIRERWPHYYEEMRGLADGSSRQVLEIVALNVRTELAFGQMDDGCTSAYCHNDGSTALLGQNWDWMPAQAPNLLLMTISQPNFPTIKMVTEAGLIGKIGINSSGVGTCFNALRIKGTSPHQMPAHLALRCALESHSAAEAASAIEAAGGLASAAYILIGDREEAIGLECTSESVVRQTQTDIGTVVHANHLLYPSAHPAEAREDEKWVRDSTARVEQMNSLLSRLVQPSESNGDVQAPSIEGFSRLFKDEEGFPRSICRAKEGESTTASLFNIVMDLEKREAVVKEGRPCDEGRVHRLDFEREIESSARL